MKIINTMTRLLPLLLSNIKPDDTSDRGEVFAKEETNATEPVINEMDAKKVCFLFHLLNRWESEAPDRYLGYRFSIRLSF